jgi:hypothetical protein
MPRMTTATVGTTYKVLAGAGAQAWLNAAIACSQDDTRRPLYRTLSVEFFKRGVQFVGCDGTMLFRTWAPYSDVGDFDAPHPEYLERPQDAVVVADADKFALGFMKTLLSALDEDAHNELTLSVEPHEQADEPPLGNELERHVLVLHALGQRLTCPLFEGPYPDWRRAQFGMDKAEIVDGMKLAVRLFAAVGKLKGAHGLECSFHGDERMIEIRTTEPAEASIRGMLMPMRRLTKTDRQTPKGDED